MVKMGARIEPDELLAEAARNGVADRDVVELMLEQGADINHLTSEGETPLILAIKKGERLLVKRLILYGADVNKPGKAKDMPLAVAKSRGNDSIIRLLQQNGARETQKP
jgi:ankyrin repeat protein